MTDAELIQKYRETKALRDGLLEVYHEKMDAFESAERQMQKASFRYKGAKKAVKDLLLALKERGIEEP